MTKRESFINKLKSVELKNIYNKYNVKNVYLFGSLLNWDFLEDSDIDLLVTFENEDKENYAFVKNTIKVMSDAKNEIEAKIKHKIDFVPEIFLKDKIKISIHKNNLLQLK